MNKVYKFTLAGSTREFREGSESGMYDSRDDGGPWVSYKYLQGDTYFTCIANICQLYRGCGWLEVNVNDEFTKLGLTVTDVPIVKVKPKHLCQCPTSDLMRKGCNCGGI